MAELPGRKTPLPIWPPEKTRCCQPNSEHPWSHTVECRTLSHDETRATVSSRLFMATQPAGIWQAAKALSHYPVHPGDPETQINVNKRLIHVKGKDGRFNTSSFANMHGGGDWTLPRLTEDTPVFERELDFSDSEDEPHDESEHESSTSLRAPCNSGEATELPVKRKRSPSPLSISHFPRIIPPEVQAFVDQIKSCPPSFLVFGLPTRSWIKTQKIPYIIARYSVLRPAKNSPITRFIGDTRLFDHRTWAYLLFGGRAEEGRAGYEDEYDRTYGSVKRRKLGDGSAARDKSDAVLGPAAKLPLNTDMHGKLSNTLTRSIAIPKQPGTLMAISGETFKPGTTSPLRHSPTTLYSPSTPPPTFSADGKENAHYSPEELSPNSQRIHSTTTNPMTSASPAPEKPTRPLPTAFNGSGLCTDNLSDACSALRQKCTNPYCTSILCAACEAAQKTALPEKARYNLALQALMPLCPGCQTSHLSRLEEQKKQRKHEREESRSGVGGGDGDVGLLVDDEQRCHEDDRDDGHDGGALGPSLRSGCTCTGYLCLSCASESAEKLEEARRKYAEDSGNRMWNSRVHGHSMGVYRCVCGGEIAGGMDEVRVCVCCWDLVLREAFAGDKGKRAVEYWAGCEGFLV